MCVVCVSRVWCALCGVYSHGKGRVTEHRARDHGRENKKTEEEEQEDDEEP